MRKKVNYRLVIFQIILLLILFFNSFIYNFLSNYWMVGFLLLVLLIFKFMYGFEKDRHRYMKNSIMNIIIYLLTFFILYYLLGILITFARNSGYYTWYAFSRFTLRIFIYIILREFLRYNMLCKSDQSKLCTFLCIFIFIMLDITNNIYSYSFTSKYNIFLFFALYVLPAFSNNLFGTYLSKKVGYKPVIFYMEIITLYPYLLPIIPNPKEYMSSIIQFGLPLVFLYREHSFFKKENDDYITRDYNKRHLSNLLIGVLFTVILVYFTSGQFHYHAIAIASCSMSPTIRRGDVVVIEKVDNKYDSIKVGDVIAYEYSKVIIVHRVERIVKDRGEYFFYTKGDANKDSDNWVVEASSIEGKINVKIPFIGYPTVWLNEL